MTKKIYIETKEGSFTIDGMTIPKAEGNRHYSALVSEVSAGTATIKKFDNTADAILIRKAEEQAWAHSELARSDIELAKVQDSDPRAIGTVGNWRTYRKALRDMNTLDGFPNNTRPTFTVTI